MRATTLMAGVALAVASVNAFSTNQVQKYGYLLGRSTADTTTNVTSAFNASSTNNLAVYYGRAQNNASPSMYALCNNPDVDMVVMGFISQFNGQNMPSFAFLSTCKTPTTITSNTTVTCSDLAKNITFCQNQGKKVLLSLGGSSSNLTLGSSAEATQAALTLWNVFGAGSGSTSRPFGSVAIDGFDFDLESGTNTTYTDVLVSSLQTLFNTTTPQRYISAAPLCANNTVLPYTFYKNANFVWPRFYNAKACCFGSKGFNSSVKTWSTFLSGVKSSIAGQTHPRFYLGGLSFDNSNSGYLGPDSFADAVLGARDIVGGKFGGVSLWEGTDGLLTLDSEGNNFLNVTKEALEVPFSSDACGRFDGFALRLVRLLIRQVKMTKSGTTSRGMAEL